MKTTEIGARMDAGITFPHPESGYVFAKRCQSLPDGRLHFAMHFADERTSEYCEVDRVGILSRYPGEADTYAEILKAMERRSRPQRELPSEGGWASDWEWWKQL